MTPKKTVSIPRLELAALSVSVKIGDVLKDELEYENIEDHYWTGSKVVLGFISNESSWFHVYVANRVQLIHDHTTPSQWHYVEILQTKVQGVCHLKILLRNHNGFKAPTSLENPQAVGCKKSHTKTVWTQIPPK